MSELKSGDLTIVVDSREVRTSSGMTVAAALWNAGITTFRTSASGERRAPLCGMGTCFECRVTIDDVAQRRACLVPVAQGLRVSTRAES